MFQALDEKETEIIINAMDEKNFKFFLLNFCFYKKYI